jgi:1-deoxy-D-xylulose-5-phosphate synthase
MEQAGHKMRLTFLRNIYHRLEQSIKSIWLGNSFFESFGMRYIGPVDGHNIAELESAFTVAREDKRSVVIHVVTEKGKGFEPAETNPSKWHGVGPFDRENPETPALKGDWSEAFGEIVKDLAEKDSRVCALTAAMRDGTGLSQFACEFPDRFFDVGICEEHLVTFASGLASNGMKPIVAIYSTFLQRAVDQVMHDVCIEKLPVVIGIDRAGIVGADGKTHNGLYDIPMLRCLPSLSICQPRCVPELRAMMELALERKCPVAIRYPRGCPPNHDDFNIEPVVWGKAEIVVASNAGSLKIWTLGDQIPKACRVCEILKEQGIESGVVNVRFIKPLDKELLLKQAGEGSHFVTIENGTLAGGFSSALREALSNSPSSRVIGFGWPDEFISQGTVEELERDFGFTAEAIAAQVLKEMKGR